MALVRIVVDEPAKPGPTDEPDSRVACIYARQALDTRVMLAHGYGIRVGTWNGQLEVSDGIGKHRRVRKIPKVDRQLQRLVITGSEGYLTLSALRWASEHGLGIVVLDAAGELVASHVPDNAPGTVSQLRTQALSGPNGLLEPKGFEVAQFLLSRKLHGQAENLVKLLSDVKASDRVTRNAGMLDDATTFDELNELERWAANTYFDAWRGNVSVPWPDSELDRIQPNWQTYQRRKAGSINTSKRYTTDPVNAMLNYAYTIGYAEARIACLGHGLEPRLGFLHADTDKRDSLALDILEVVRPEIDRYILGLLGYGSEPRTFSYKDFCEPRGYPHGTVRLVAPLTHEIAEQAMSWQDIVGEAARQVADILGAPIGSKGRRSHNLAMQKAEFVSRPVDIDAILPGCWWESFRSILPTEKAHPKGGFAPISSRNVIAAMIYMEHHHRQWAQVPAGFGVSRRTMAGRRQEWKRLGIWDSVWSIVLDLAARPMP